MMKITKIEIGDGFYTTLSSPDGGHNHCLCQSAQYVGRELIFHTEDGKRFTAKVQLEEIYKEG